MTPEILLYLNVHWNQRPWWSAYERGTITSDAFARSLSIYRHHGSWQVRLYADFDDLDGDPLFVNGHYLGILTEARPVRSPLHRGG